MTILNENITLHEFNTTFTYKGRQPKDFFRNRAAESRDLLPVGTVLWKCGDFGVSHSSPVSEWWAPHNHLIEVLKRCGSLGTSIQRYCRARYAVIWEWRSALSFLIEARLLKTIYGFRGQTAPVDTRFSVRGQDTEMKNITLIGGDAQLCIPNLTTAHIEQLSQTASDSLPRGWRQHVPPGVKYPTGTVIRGGRS